MSRVFVAQVPWKFDRASGVAIANVDITSAWKHGKVIEMLPLGQIMPALAIKSMRNKMADFDFDKDYVLLVGNPSLYCAACVIAASRTGGRVNVLQWERDQSADSVEVNGKLRKPGYYMPVTIDLATDYNEGPLV